MDVMPPPLFFCRFRGRLRDAEELKETTEPALRLRFLPEVLFITLDRLLRVNEMTDMVVYWIPQTTLRETVHRENPSIRREGPSVQSFGIPAAGENHSRTALARQL